MKSLWIHRQQGFTLIELVMVIVIIGILAAVAIPKFVDLSSSAAQAAVNNMAGTISSASTTNFSGCQAANLTGGTGSCVTVQTCADGANVVTPTMPTTYALTGTGAAGAANGTPFACTLTYTFNGTKYVASVSLLSQK
jgi:MSHA pilin protein MshA